jgi:hypothetical protein
VKQAFQIQLTKTELILRVICRVRLSLSGVLSNAFDDISSSTKRGAGEDVSGFSNRDPPFDPYLAQIGPKQAKSVKQAFKYSSQDKLTLEFDVHSQSCLSSIKCIRSFHALDKQICLVKVRISRDPI